MSKESLVLSKVNSSSVESTIKSVLPACENRAPLASLRITPKSKRITSDPYPVADFVGRWFLRACYWFDVCTFWKKKYEPPVFTAVGTKAQSSTVSVSSATMAAPVLHMQSTIATSTHK